MRIECPACATAYEVPADRLAPGQAVRCARCDSDWTPLPAPDPPPAPIPPEPVPVAVELPPEPPPLEIEPEPELEPAPPPASVPRRGKLALRLAWAASLLLIAGALWAAYAGRERVMQAWPPSTRAYAALGLAAKP